MTTLDVSLDRSGAARPADNYLTHSHGWKSWLMTLDHKRIGVMYLCSTVASLFLGGVFALLLRTELLTPGPTIMDHDTYNRMFTLHGAIMVFLFIIPAIPAGIGNFILPIMLGAKDVAFPKLNLASYYLWIFGAIFFVTAMIRGSIDTGWTFYTPYSVTTPAAGVVWATMGVFILGFSSIFTGLNFIVSIHKLRPQGMSWFRMPLFLWALYATSVVQLLGTPVIAITVLLLTVERTLHVGIFDPALGGDPVLFQHFFWFYSHPAVYLMILPGFGIISEIIGVHSRKNLFGYRFIALSSIAIALVGFLVWGHHLFTSGQSPLASVLFSALTFTIAIPSAIKVFNWLATLYKSSLQLTTPMWYALGFIMLFVIGGLTGVFLAALAVDIHLHDTYFVVAHFHYVMVGGTMMALLGGLYHWWPKMFGRMYNETLGRIGAVLVTVGFNATFFPQFIMGTRGMPRRYFAYLPEFQVFHVASTIGAYLLGFGILLAFATLLWAALRGRQAAANPWGGATLEWQCSSPPPHDNFAVAPAVGDPYDFSHLTYDPKIDGYVDSGIRPTAAAGAKH